MDPRRNLAKRLTPLVDRVRGLGARLGFRAYRVFLVHAHWTGARSGFGDLVVDRRTELLPVPQVRDLSTLSQTIRSTGRVEDGDVYVDQIPASIPECELMGQTPDLRDPEEPRAGRETSDFWWEIEEDRGGEEVQVRAFVPRSAPSLNRGRFMWTITLAKRERDRVAVADPDQGRTNG